MAEKPPYEELERRIQELEKAESERNLAEDRLKKIFNHTQDAIFIHDLEGKILDVNDKMCRIYGLTKEEALEVSIEDVSSSRMSMKVLLERWQKALNGEKLLFEWEALRPKDKSVFNVEVSIQMLSLHDKDIILANVRDITERKQTEETLRKSEELLNASQRLSKAGGWEWNVEKQTMYWTEETYRIHDFTPRVMEPGSTEHINRSEECYEPEDRPVILTAFQRCVEEGQPYDLEFPFTTAKGRRLWIRTTASPVRASGKIIRVIGNIIDITDRKRAETYHEMGREILQILNEPGDLQVSIQRVLAALKTRTGFDAVGLRLQEGEDFPYFAQDGFSQNFLQTENTLVERGKDGVVCRDKDGNVRLECTCGLVLSGKTAPCNPLFTHGGSCWTNDSFPLLDLPPDQDPRMHPRNNCIHQGYASVALIPIRTSDRIVGLIQLNNKRKGSFTLQTIEILEDIAAHIGSALMRKRAEEDLEKSLQKITASRNELEHEVAERFKVEDKLKVAIDAAEAANKTKSEFLANMSHEIRTPMNSIIGFSQLLLSENFGPLNKRQAKYADHIIESGNMLLAIINDILDLSRVESGKIRIQPEPFNIKRFMEHIKGILSVLAEKKELAFKVEVDSGLSDYLTGDEKLIAQILKNLISNAVNFTEQGIVHVSVENRSGDLRTFKVRDTGIGIPEEKQHRLFDKFFQADTSYTKKVQGTGLGLAISKSLVELMGGEIEFESEQGKGSTFYFTLELPAGDTKAANPVQEASSPEPECSVQPSLKILLAEDDRLTRKAMTHFLEKAGYTVTRAESGNEVLSILDSDRFDIILMDVQMPEMDGVEATKIIRNSTSRRWNPEIPILALTAYAMAGDREQFIDAGMTDYLSKPVNFTELNQKIHQLMQDRPAAKEPPAPGDEDHLCKDEDIADIRAFLECNKEDPEFAGKILKSFPGHVSERMARLEAAVENKDVEETAVTAHKFIALFSAVYIRSACKISKELQAAARNRDPELCRNLFQDLKTRMNKSVQYIESISEK